MNVGEAAPSVVVCPECGTKNRVPGRARGFPRCASCHRDLPWMEAAGDADFADATATSLAVLVDLWAPWCGPCRLIAPGIEQVATELAGQLKVVKVNVDEAPGVAARFSAQSIPTLLVLRDGKPVARQVGNAPTDQLRAWVRRAVTSPVA